MAMGAVDALKAANRKALVVGINASREVMDLIKSGDIVGSGDYDTFAQGCLAVEMAVRSLRKEDVPRELMLKPTVIDKTNDAPFDQPFEKRECPTLEQRRQAMIGRSIDEARHQGTMALDEPRLNLPELTVSELSTALKRTIEDAYGYVRVRGELGKVSYHGNGHVYFDLKDERACIAGVIWRGTAPRIKLQARSRPRSGDHRPAHHLSRPLAISDHRRDAGAGRARRADGAARGAQARNSSPKACSTRRASSSCRICRR